MRSKLIIAFILFSIGIIGVLDWVLIVTPKEVADLTFLEVKQMYYDRLPAFFQAFFPYYATLIYMLAFTIAGILFIMARHILYTLLGIFSLVLAVWQLFTLM